MLTETAALFVVGNGLSIVSPQPMKVPKCPQAVGELKRTFDSPGGGHGVPETIGGSFQVPTPAQRVAEPTECLGQLLVMRRRKEERDRFLTRASRAVEVSEEELRPSNPRHRAGSIEIRELGGAR
jgi:hypothetical protein